MITFICRHCKQKFRVENQFAGKKGYCPHCRQSVTIPLQDELTFKEIIEDSQDSESAIQLQDGLPVQDEFEVIPEEPAEDSEDTESRQKRLLPIYLDIFLYPLNKPGLVTLLVLTLMPLLGYPLRLLSCTGALLYLGLMVCLLGYTFWYFSLCVRKSAEGRVRAPGSLIDDMDATYSDMILLMLRTFLLIAICLTPSIIYRSMTESTDVILSTDIIFWLILSGCIFFLPMMLLISVMFDSFWAVWNPRVLFGGIFSSFFQYLVLVVTFYIPIGLYIYLLMIANKHPNILSSLAINACSIYLLMISSHLLGWYFYKNEEKLYWAV